MKAVVAAFNHEKALALVGAFSVITNLRMELFEALLSSDYSVQDDDEQRYFNLKECLWFCMTSLTPQGGGEAPKNLSGVPR